MLVNRRRFLSFLGAGVAAAAVPVIAEPFVRRLWAVPSNAPVGLRSGTACAMMLEMGREREAAMRAAWDATVQNMKASIDRRVERAMLYGEYYVSPQTFADLQVELGNPVPRTLAGRPHTAEMLRGLRYGGDLYMTESAACDLALEELAFKGLGYIPPDRAHNFLLMPDLPSGSFLIDDRGDQTAQRGGDTST